MILGLIGLILNFVGSIILIFDVISNLGLPKPIYPIRYNNGKIIREKIRYEYQRDGYLKKVKIKKEEIKVIISLSLLSLGFLFQIIDYFC